MKIILHGQQAFGKAVLENLLENNKDIVAVCSAPDKENTKIDPLVELAREKDLPVYQPSSWKTPEALEKIKSFEADLCIMAYVLLMVPKAVLDEPTYGTIQYHPSILPMHKGPSSINWPIYNGEKKTGITIFWPDDGLDTGPILLQKYCDISSDDTLGSLYFNKLFPLGVEAIAESIELIETGIAPKLYQEKQSGSYESWFGRPESKIDWNNSAHSIYNQIRASNPQPGAWTTLNGVEVKVYDAAHSDLTGNSGEIVNVNNDGFVVAAGQNSILIKKLRVNKEKISANDYIKDNKIKIGDKFE
jgi:methionyl-tRNA formyltransferase